jgi:outer membrane biosynthesis protein TonB
LHGKPKHIDREKSRYRNRILACIITAEIIAISFFHFWPAPDNSDEMNRNTDFSEDVLAIEDIVRTEQTNRPASPPKPQVPIPEPTDEIIEDEITEIDDLNISEFSDSLSVAMLGNQGNSDEPVSNPQTSPSVVRIVEPTVPDVAKEAEVKAEIWVTFLVDEQGRVEEANISEIKLYDRESGEVKDVDSIGYGLTEATLDAALQWRFRPAKNNGEVVRAYTRNIFTFGF